MTLQEVKKICESHHTDKDKPFKDGCQKCDFWKSTRGCEFYNRPIDWRIR